MIPLVITVSPVRSIPISQALSDVMPVSQPAHVVFSRTKMAVYRLCLAPDVLAHRQLAAAIGHSPLHASLHSKDYVERILSVVNRRHRMAQFASRGSIEFYVGLALKGKMSNATDKEATEEEAYVIRAFTNGIGVFVHRYDCRTSIPCLVCRLTFSGLLDWVSKDW